MSKSDIKFIIIALLFICVLLTSHYVEEKMLLEENAEYSAEKFVYIKNREVEQHEGLKLRELRFNDELEDYFYTYRAETSTMISGNDSQVQCQAIGTNYLYPEFFGMDFIEGNFFSHDRKLEPVIIISSELSNQLFGSSNTVGLTVNLMDRVYTIIGVYQEEDYNFFMPFDLYEELAPNQGMDIVAFANRSGNYEYSDQVYVSYYVNLHHYYLFEYTVLLNLLNQTDNILLFITGILIAYYILKMIIKVANRFKLEYQSKLVNYYHLQVITHYPLWFAKNVFIILGSIVFIYSLFVVVLPDVNLPMHWIPNYLFDLNWYVESIRSYYDITIHTEVENVMLSKVYWNLLVVIPLYFIALSIMVSRLKKRTLLVDKHQKIL